MIASCLANRPIEPWAGVCDTCKKNVRPMAINQATASIAYFSWKTVGDYEMSTRLYNRFLARGFFGIVPHNREGSTTYPTEVPYGAGAVIHWVLQKIFRVKVSADCSCMFWVRQMNIGGLAWTIRNRKDITLAMLHQFMVRWPDSKIPKQLRSIGANSLLWFAIAWRYLVSSRIHKVRSVDEV